MEQKNVLIIDDDTRNIYALKAVLRSRNIPCQSASTAAEGLQLLSQDHQVGVVLMDIMMPDMDGYETIVALRAIPGNSQLPVIAVTAKAMVGDREKCLEAGADNYISKPIDVDELLTQIHQYLSVEK
ncbi:response regulator receiver domain-containing protein [Chitinophaga niastensis]|uniref:Response regulator receiver domain-containing protein n=1 Tax=Chitinophaga niastensis TaxID=536980 RepID=A0A2P8HRA0_CHINA|nr:response regulator [Chitinophaga niastensis]PSL48740.1 response regulator receiver domain-containing protein [Chitinophaga niastensis]